MNNILHIIIYNGYVLIDNSIYTYTVHMCFFFLNKKCIHEILIHPSDVIINYDNLRIKKVF